MLSTHTPFTFHTCKHVSTPVTPVFHAIADLRVASCSAPMSSRVLSRHSLPSQTRQIFRCSSTCMTKVPVVDLSAKLMPTCPLWLLQAPAVPWSFPHGASRCPLGVGGSHTPRKVPCQGALLNHTRQLQLISGCPPRSLVRDMENFCEALPRGQRAGERSGPHEVNGRKLQFRREVEAVIRPHAAGALRGGTFSPDQPRDGTDECLVC